MTINRSACSSLDRASLMQASPTTTRCSLHPTDPIMSATRAPSHHRPSRCQRTDWPGLGAKNSIHRQQVPTLRPGPSSGSLRGLPAKTGNSSGVQFASPQRYRPQSKPIRSRSPFGYMTQLTPGGNFDASPSQSSPTERTRPVACSPWMKLLVYSVCGTLLARLGRDCSRGSTTMFSSFADLAFPNQNCSLAKSRCVPRPWRETATDSTAAPGLGSPDPKGTFTRNGVNQKRLLL